MKMTKWNMLNIKIRKIKILTVIFPQYLKKVINVLWKQTARL